MRSLFLGVHLDCILSAQGRIMIWNANNNNIELEFYRNERVGLRATYNKAYLWKQVQTGLESQR